MPVKTENPQFFVFSVHFQVSWSEDRQACEVWAVKSPSAEGAVQIGQKAPSE